jgi:DNA-binding NtrC family response regulator
MALGGVMKADDDVRRVLVVDDEKVIADSLTAILCSRGYMAKAAYSAAAAMIAAKDLSPHTVISDVLMPEMNGIELAEYLAQHHPDCMVLLMSGDSASPGLLDMAMRRGHSHPTWSKLLGPMQMLELLAELAPVA